MRAWPATGYFPAIPQQLGHSVFIFLFVENTLVVSRNSQLGRQKRLTDQGFAMNVMILGKACRP